MSAITASSEWSLLHAAGIAASPLLGVANLMTGVLNLGLTGYNTYQLRGISKLQKVSNGSQHMQH